MKTKRKPAEFPIQPASNIVLDVVYYSSQVQLTGSNLPGPTTLNTAV